MPALFARVRSSRHAVLVGVWIAAALTTLFVVRVVGAGWRSGYPIFFLESSSYLHVAGLGPFRSSFWFGDRPVVTPLVLWVLARNVRLIVLTQVVVYVGACWFLVFVVWRSVSTWIARTLAVVGVAGPAVQPRFALWHTHVLSESLACRSVSR